MLTTRIQEQPNSSLNEREKYKEQVCTGPPISHAEAHLCAAGLPLINLTFLLPQMHNER